MAFSVSVLRLTLLALSLSVAFSALAADKPRIEKEADIPRFSYSIAYPLEKVVRDRDLFVKTTAPVRADMESVLAKYLQTLMLLDFLLGNYDAALAISETVRALEEKPSDKLLSGLRLRAVVVAVKQTGSLNTLAYFSAVGNAITQELEGYPFAVISNDIKSYKAGAELAGEGRVLGNVRDVLQATLDKNGGALSSDYAPSLIGTRYAL